MILASRSVSLMLLEQYFRTREALGRLKAGVEASTAFLSTYHFPLILAVIDGLGLEWGWDCFFLTGMCIQNHIFLGKNRIVV